MDMQYLQRSSAPNPYLFNTATLASQVVPPSYQYPTSGIDYPGMNDVMCGRGGGSNNHIGNIRFRQLVNEHKLRYLAASKSEKPKIAVEVVRIWRSLDPPGRFLTKSDVSMGDDSLWHDVGDKKSREKASQCLRERTPDVMPFIKHLQAQQEKEKKEKKGDATPDKQTSGSAESPGSASPSLTARSHPNKSFRQEPGEPMPEGSAQRMNAARTTGPTVSPFSAEAQNTAEYSDKGGGDGNAPKRSRQEISDSVPVAATLMKDVFGDDPAEGQSIMTMEAYQQSVEQFLESAPKGDGVDAYDAGDDRSELMETLSSTSWIRSFKSIDSASMLMSTTQSLRNIAEEGDEDGLDDSGHMESSQATFPTGNLEIPAFRPTLGEMEGATRSQRLRLGQTKNASNTSMLSDLSDFSKRTSTRSMKMGNSKGFSNLSMLSELTDISNSMRGMDLGYRDDEAR